MSLYRASCTILLSLFLAAPALAGLVDSQDTEFQLWYGDDWVPTTEKGELVPTDKPGDATLEVIGAVDMHPSGVEATLRQIVSERNAGRIKQDIEKFEALGGREGVALFSFRIRMTGFHHMTWIGVPLSDGRLAVVALRLWNSSIPNQFRRELYQVAGTAALQGQLRDIPFDELREHFLQHVIQEEPE